MTTIMKKITKGIVLNGESSDLTDNLEGSLFHNSSTARIKSYIQGAVREILTNSQSQVLTNKTIDADNNNISNLQLSNLKAGVLSTSISGTSTDTEIPSAKAVYTSLSAQNEASEIAFTPITSVAGPKVQDAIGQVQSNLQSHTGASSNVHGLAVGSSVVGTTDNQTLTTKTINADNNTISNLEVDNLKSGVLNTSITLASASDTQIPSALAVKTYVDANSGGGGSGNSDYLIDQIIYKTSTAYTSSTGLIYKRVREATTLTSFSSLMIDKGLTLLGNLTFDIKVGQRPTPLTRFNGIVRAIAPQTDGKIIYGGSFTTYDGKTAKGIVRLNSNGSIDTTFITGGGVISGDVEAITIQPDGKILVGGDFNGYNNSGAISSSVPNCLMRLNSNGSLDETFFPTGNEFLVKNNSNGIYDIKVQSDGKIIICGGFTPQATGGWSAASGMSKAIARLNSDGTVDTDFCTNVGGTNTIDSVGASAYFFRTMLIMPDGSIFVVGTFQSYKGNSSYTGIIKLTSAGLSDATFVAGSVIYPHEVAYHLGDIIIAGSFTSYGGVARKRIAKINATTGALITDPAVFNIGTGFNSGLVNALTVLSDNTILVGGSFTTYNGVGPANFRKLNSDGTAASLATATLSSSVSCVAIQSDNKILLGGGFTTVNSLSYGSTVRLLASGSIDQTYDIVTSIFDTLPSFNFSTLSNNDIINGTIARPNIDSGYYVIIDINQIPSSYIGSFYITLY